MTLLSFVRATDRPESVAHLRSFCADVHTVPMHRSTGRDIGHLVRSLASQKPFLIGRDWVPEMADAAAKLVQSQQFDAIHADQLPMAQYALWARQQAAKQSTTPATAQPSIVLDEHNAVYLIFKRLASTERNPVKRAVLEMEWRKLQRYEEDVCRRMDKVVWVTQEDWQAMHPGATPTEDDPAGSRSASIQRGRNHWRRRHTPPCDIPGRAALPTERAGHSLVCRARLPPGVGAGA
ncbi:MAG: hypothetical protein R2873_33255 [Caldilineaceae bacterium]